MSESRLKILVGVLLIAVVVSMLFNFGVIGPDDTPTESVCADGTDGTVVGGTARPDPPDVSTLGLAQVTSDLPEGQIGDSVQWALDALNIHADGMTEAMVTERFAPNVLEEFTAAEVVAEIQNLARRGGPYALVGYVEEPTDTVALAMVRMNGREYKTLRVEIVPSEGSGADAFGRIADFTVR